MWMLERMGYGTCIPLHHGKLSKIWIMTLTSLLYIGFFFGLLGSPPRSTFSPDKDKDVLLFPQERFSVVPRRDTFLVIGEQRPYQIKNMKNKLHFSEEKTRLKFQLLTVERQISNLTKFTKLGLKNDNSEKYIKDFFGKNSGQQISSSDIQKKNRSQIIQRESESEGKPKLYIQPIGRLGNQLFQIASLIGISMSTLRQPIISPVFDSIDQVFTINLTKGYPPIDIRQYKEKSYAHFEPDVYKKTNEHLNLVGYFQSWRYFSKYSDLVKRMFAIKPELRDYVVRMKDLVYRRLRTKSKEDPKNENDLDILTYIGIHVRRTDMHPNYAVIPESYIHKAMAYFRRRIKNPLFVIVSDDPSWCEEHINGEGIYIARPEEYCRHFALLLSCDHHVISVGSFGWWAAWLRGGETVYYKDPVPKNSSLYKGFSRVDYFPPTWIGMR